MRIGPPQIGKNRIENNWNFFFLVMILISFIGAPCVKLPTIENNRS